MLKTKFQSLKAHCPLSTFKLPLQSLIHHLIHHSFSYSPSRFSGERLGAFLVPLSPSPCLCLCLCLSFSHTHTYTHTHPPHLIHQPALLGSALDVHLESKHISNPSEDHLVKPSPLPEPMDLLPSWIPNSAPRT